MLMNRRQQGFTLVELMITLAVVIVLLAVGIPLFGRILSTNQAAAEVNSLVTALQLARNEAVNRGRPVTLCAGTAACGASWANGWMVYEDLDSDGTLDAGENILRIWADPPNAAFTTTANALTFSPVGDLSSPGALAKLGLNFSSGSTGTQQRCVLVTVAGQVRQQNGACP